MASQMKLDKQKYVNQVESNRRAGKKSAENKSKLNAKKPTQKSGVSVDGNADGTRDSKQVLTSVNEERRKKGEEPKEPKEKKRIEVTDSLDKAISTNFDVDGYNMANDLWFKYNGRQPLSPKEKSYLRKCVADHGADFICGCITALKSQKKVISTTTLPAIIRELKQEAEKKKQEADKHQRFLNAVNEIDMALKEAGDTSIGFRDWPASYREAVMELLQDNDFANNGIYHVEIAKDILLEMKNRKEAGEKVYINTNWLLAELEKRKEQTDEEKS